MNLIALWSWVILAFGILLISRQFNRTAGTILGILTAMLWVGSLQATFPNHAQPWSGWMLCMVLAGSAAYPLLAVWSAGSLALQERPAREAKSSTGVVPAESPAGCDLSSDVTREILDRYDDWADEHRLDPDPWPAMDEFIRSVLFSTCGATHVRCYRLITEAQELAPLHETELENDGVRMPARGGIIGHVLTTNRAFLRGDAMLGEKIERIVSDGGQNMDWCFAVSSGRNRLGLVTAGKLENEPDIIAGRLRAVERLIGHCWCLLHETVQGRSAIVSDPVSGLLTREAFLTRAADSLRASYKLGEPSAVAVVAVEGLRQINDSGQWETADQIIRDLSSLLRSKTRHDDVVGRFDGSRFIVLFRRVDSELASLIIRQLMSRLTAACSDSSRWPVHVGVRCGVAGTGLGQPDLRSLVSQAVVYCQQARLNDAPIAGDLICHEPEVGVVGA